MIRRLLRIGLPVFFLLVGALGAKVLSGKRPKAEKKDRPEVKRTVEVYRPAPFEGRFVIKALGQTVPAREVTLQAEVAGLAVSLHPELVPGGRVLEGDVLVDLEKADYRLAVRQAQAQVEQARVRVQEEEGRGAVAEREWALLGESVEANARGRALALREPQLKSAQANLEAAQSALSKSRLALKRTTIRSPMNAVVMREGVEVGQRLGPGYGMVTLAGTDSWWVQVSVSQERLRFIEAPGVSITVHAQGDERGLPGRIARRLVDLDPVGKMVRLVVEVDDPLRLESPGAPLYLKDTVEVRFACAADDVLALPRKALRPQDRIWTADGESRLQMNPADVYWKDDRLVLVRGLDPKSVVVTSHLALPTAGTALKFDAPKVLKTAPAAIEPPAETPDTAPPAAAEGPEE